MSQLSSVNVSCSRRQALAGLGLGSLAVATGVGLSGCGQGGGSRGGGKAVDLKVPTYVESSIKPEGLITSNVDGVAPILVGSPKKFVQAVKEKPAKGGTFSSFQVLWGPPVPGRESNGIWQALEKSLGVDRLDITMVPIASYSDKLATLLASGSLPDLIYVADDDPNAARAMNDGAFLELNEYLEGDKVKEYPNLASTPENAWKYSAEDGRILGIPMPSPARVNMMTLRLDAMKKIGTTKVPDNGKDLKELFLELAKIKELGGRKVWGHGELVAGTFEAIHNLGQEFHIVDGKVTYKYLLPQYEDHLKYMRELWTGGFFHPDALGQVDPELFKQGQVLNYEASFAGLYWIPNAGRIDLCKRSVPSAEFIHYAMPSIEGGTGTHAISKGYGGIVCIPADRGSDKDKVKTLLRMCNWYRSPLGSTEALLVNHGVKGRNYNMDSNGSITPIPGAPIEGHCTWLGLLHNPVNELPEQDKDAVKNIMATYEASTKSGKLSEVDYVTSQKYIKSKSKLDELFKEYYNGIVSGRRPLKDLAEYQSEWKKNGGQEVLDDLESQLDKKA